MKKAIVLTSVLVLALAGIAEAKGFRMSSSRSYSSSKAVAPAKATTQQKTQQKADADFKNTPPRATVGQNAAATNTNTGGVNGFLTGAMAGYMLSSALSSNEAQAQEAKTAQAVENQPNSANTAVAEPLPAVPTFKAIDPQNDPYLIEKTTGYLRYCLNGVQYLISQTNTQLPPTLMVDKNNAPVQCRIEP